MSAQQGNELKSAHNRTQTIMIVSTYAVSPVDLGGGGGQYVPSFGQAVVISSVEQLLSQLCLQSHTHTRME
jgi:hypothetical protein